ncbi:MFS transporter [Paraburkholderia sp. 1N]|uniref:MFS transporter n=1 Tax=Paraburkholderia solitsugae TaxID=2675748 RepID=A0ABX2BT91_9BURK|nr:MFS transporter [Paraburkholderia solitsugae]
MKCTPSILPSGARRLCGIAGPTRSESRDLALNYVSDRAPASANLEGLNVIKLIEESTLSAFQIRVFCLCALVALIDGFDSQLLGPAARSIALSLDLRVADFGSIFSASQVGFFIGALAFGPAADRWGRRWLLIATTSVFATFTLFTALAHSFGSLLLCRLFVGLALGGASPSFIGLAAEYLPLRRRTQFVTMLWAAVPLGGMLGAMASTALIQTAGWQASFYVGGIVPLLVALSLVFFLPESISFLVARGASPEKVRSIVEKVARGTVAHVDRFIVDTPTLQSTPLKALFTHGRTVPTLYLWTLCFMAWMALIVVSFWTPTLIQNVGFSASAAAATLLFNNVGAVVGTVLIGSLMHRFGNFRVLTLSFFAAAWAVGALGTFTSAFSHVVISSTLAGFFLSASCAGLIAIAAGSYPVSIRSTGIGWAIGVGRIGSIVGPLLAGRLLALNWSVRDIYLALSVPCLCAVVLVILLRRNANSRSGSGRDAFSTG